MKKAISLVVLSALVFSAGAAPVTVQEAKTAARAWVARGGTLGASMGLQVARVSTLAVATATSTTDVYCVSMKGGGTLFLSSDTTYEPVVAFTSATNDFSTLDVKSPLFALLTRDADARAKRIAPQANAALARASLAATSSATSSAADKWQALLAEGAALEANGTIKMPLLAHVANVGDCRVAPLVQSKWDQTTADGKLCYNRFTPILKTGSHATCGCVATAMAQVMRYHEFPTAKRESVTRECYINTYLTTTEDPAYITNLTTQAGVYDWSKMPLVPANGATDEECAEIGKLTSDAGIAVSMMYGTDSSGSSGAFSCLVPDAFTDVFGYANADYYGVNGDVTDDAGVVAGAMLANFDAGYPVIMGIGGNSGGHAIVGDGYGYNDETLYVHLNMGWSGQSDFWYNLPAIDSTPYSFSVFDDLVFNIFPEGTARAVLSGRVVDEASNVVEGATVRVYPTGETTCLAETTTSASGVYGVQIANGTYDVVVTKTGYPIESLASVTVPATSRRTKMFGCSIVYPNWTKWYSGLSYVTSVGNTHTADVALSSAAAVIVTNGVEMGFKTLNAAIDAAREIDATLSPDDAVTIILQADLPLEANATIDFPCVIMGTSTQGSATPVVTRASLGKVGDAALTVTSTLTLQNVSFSSSGTTLVAVRVGGELDLGANVDFGVVDAAAVSTATSNGLVILGEISSAFTLDCAAANDVGDVFALTAFSAADDVAAHTASLIANASDTFGEMRGVAKMVDEKTGEVVFTWGEIPVPLDAAVGYFVDASGATNTAARLDRLFANFSRLQANGETADTNEIILFDRAALSMDARVAITNTTVVLRGATAGVTVAKLGAKSGFDILAGGTLILKDITFTGFEGETFMDVAGGALVLNSGATLDGLKGTNLNFGPVLLRAGALTMRTGAVITNGVSAGPGGGITAMGGALALEGGTIANCSALRYGGGVCVYNESATLTLAGDIAFAANALYSTGVREDIWLSTLSGNRPTVTSPLTADAQSIALSADANKEGQVFATYDESLDAHEANVAARAFFCASPYDATKTLRGAAEDGTILWAEKTAALDDDEREAAVVRLTYEDGSEVYYGELVAAFNGATAKDFTATILKDAVTFADDLVISGKVTICSEGASAFSLARADDAFVHVASEGNLVLTNLHVTVAEPAQSSDEPLIFIQGGALTLEAGAWLSGVYKDETYSETARAASAVAVYAGGTFTMKPLSRISDCANNSVDEVKNVQSGVGAGVLVDGGSTAFLLGGTISNCRASMGGAVYVCNKSTAYVSGAFTATDNVSVLDDALSNVVVEDLSELYLAAPLNGSSGIGASLGYQYLVRDTNLVARVEDWTAWDLNSLTNSAATFVNDDNTRVRGFVVTNATAALVVWSTAIGADGSYVSSADPTTTYYAAGDVPTSSRVTPQPIAFVSIVKGEGLVTLALTNAVKGCFYSVFAVGSLEDGFSLTNAVGALVLEPVTNFQWQIDEPRMELTLPATESAQFYKVRATEGDIP